jgi:hypothetical protein
MYTEQITVDTNEAKLILPRSPTMPTMARCISLDLFGNPVGYLTSPAVFQAKALQNRVFNGSCSETEASKQLYYKARQTFCKNYSCGR